MSLILAVGDTVWRTPDANLSRKGEVPIPLKVTAETSRSWVLSGWPGGIKIAKADVKGGKTRFDMHLSQYPSGSFTIYLVKQELEKILWLQGNRYSIAKEVEKLNYRNLKKVEAIIKAFDQAQMLRIEQDDGDESLHDRWKKLLEDIDGAGLSEEEYIGQLEEIASDCDIAKMAFQENLGHEDGE